MRELVLFISSVRRHWRIILPGSLTVVILGLLSGTGIIHVPGFVYWLIILVTLFWAFFLAWREEYRARQAAEKALLSAPEKSLLIRSRKLSGGLLDLMRRFPNSPAVLSPFSMTWRPLVGTTDFGWDVKEMITWHAECVAFLDSIADVYGVEAALKLPLVRIISEKVFPDFPPSALVCLIYFGDIEDFLLRKVAWA
jgi:hypothetical protein